MPVPSFAESLKFRGCNLRLRGLLLRFGGATESWWHATEVLGQDGGNRRLDSVGGFFVQWAGA